MAIASIDRVGSRVVWAIGARDENSTYTFSVSDDRFNVYEIAQAIHETEAEIVRDLFDAYHPQREDFLTWVTVANKASIPTHFGQVESVKIAGRLARPTTQTNLQFWSDHPEIYGEGDDQYYSTTNNVLEFIGGTAQVRIGQFTPTYPVAGTSTGALQIDSIFENILVAGAISRLAKIGVEPDLITQYSNLYEAGRSSLRQPLSGEIKEVQSV